MELNLPLPIELPNQGQQEPGAAFEGITLASSSSGSEASRLRVISNENFQFKQNLEVLLQEARQQAERFHIDETWTFDSDSDNEL